MYPGSNPVYRLTRAVTVTVERSDVVIPAGTLVYYDGLCQHKQHLQLVIVDVDHAPPVLREFNRMEGLDEGFFEIELESLFPLTPAL